MKITKSRLKRIIREALSDEEILAMADAHLDSLGPVDSVLSLGEAEMLVKKYRLNMSAQQLWDENRHSTYEELESRLERWAGKMRPVR